ncbi:MAG: response regulator transcription factor [Gammaproteobacteria bacterium]
MQRKTRILIIEDEEPIRNGLEDVFVFHGYETDTAATGDSGLQKALSGRFDLILLDVMLPGMDGFSVLERIRDIDREQAVILLTAKNADEDVVQGLSLGADDYVAKPFSVTQLVLRAQAVLRRSQRVVDDPLIYCGDLQIDTRNLSGRRAETNMHFTRREMDLLEYLHAHHDRPVPREELLHKVWGYARNLDIETRTVDIHIGKLRRKIEPLPAEPRYLVTVRNAGYRLLSD